LFAPNNYGNAGRWFTFDDSVVRTMPPGDVCTSAGYLLFYTSVNFANALPSFE